MNDLVSHFTFYFCFSYHVCTVSKFIVLNCSAIVGGGSEQRAVGSPRSRQPAQGHEFHRGGDQ